MMSAHPEDIQIANQESVKTHYSNLCTGIYQEILAQGEEAPAGSNWTVQHDRANGISTWILREDKNLGRVGTSGELHVKLFHGPNSYDFVKTENFIERADLVCDAARKLIGNYRKHNSEAADKILNWMDGVQEEFNQYIKVSCNIDHEKMRNQGMEHFKPKYEVAKSELRKLASNFAAAVKVLSDQSGNEINIENILSEMERAEKLIIKDRGRPTIMKIGNVGGGETPGMMMSAQFPTGLETIPSSLRDAFYQKKTANHVLDITGVVQNNQISVQLMIDGHSSYTPIAESNKFLRLDVGRDAFKEKVEETARSYRRANPDSGRDANQPIVVPLSTMVLLSPLAMQNIEKIVFKNESESMQVKEGNIAMNLFAYSNDLHVLHDDKGEIMYVKLDHTSMNMPSNPFAVANKFVQSSLQERINSKGMSDYIRNIGSVIRKNHEEIMNLFDDKSEGINLIAKLLAYTPRLSIPKDAHLRLHYQQLNTYLEQYKNQLSLPIDKQSKSQIQELEKSCNSELMKIKKIETANHQIYQKNIDKLTDYLKANQNNMKELMSILNSMQQKDIPHEMKTLFLMINRYLTALDIYCNKKNFDLDAVFHFQANYLLSNERMGRDIETFCKSGEDRTGWMRITLMAITAFNLHYGRDPDFNNPKDVVLYNRKFVNTSHELSASLDCTAYNSASRGLQVFEVCTTDVKPMECDKMMAVLAKGVYEDKNKMKPTIQLKIDGDQLDIQPTQAALSRRGSWSAEAKLSGSSDSMTEERPRSGSFVKFFSERRGSKEINQSGINAKRSTDSVNYGLRDSKEAVNRPPKKDVENNPTITMGLKN